MQIDIPSADYRCETCYGGTRRAYTRDKRYAVQLQVLLCVSVLGIVSTCVCALCAVAHGGWRSAAAPLWLSILIFDKQCPTDPGGSQCG